VIFSQIPLDVRVKYVYNEIRKRGVSVKVSEFIRELKKQGIKFAEYGKEHDKYVNPKTGQSARLPRHPSKEIKTGTREQILKDLGLK